LLRSLNPSHVLADFPDESQNLFIGRGALSKLVQLFLDSRSKEGTRGRVASQFGGGLNSLIDCVGQSDRSLWHLFLHPIKEVAEGVRDGIILRKE
jgi:hypothetical protein